MIFHFIQIISAIASNITYLGDQNFTIEKVSYSFGFWSQYASMTNNYEINVNLFNLMYYQGYQLMRLMDASYLKLLYYQPWVYNDTSPTKHLILLNHGQQLMDLQYDALKYEGMWIYHFFTFISNTLQVIVYNLEICQMQTIQYEIPHQVFINLGGQYQFNNGVNKIQLAYFVGRISTLDQTTPVLYATEQQFLDYFSTINQPTAYCKYEIFTATIIEDYEYQKGLILMESWVKIDYVSVYYQFIKTLNVTASVFGIELVLGLYSNVVQKLIDLQYCVIQAVSSEIANGVYFQVLQRNMDFQFDERQYLNGVSATQTGIIFKSINQNLKEWHYVQMYYGYENDNPIQYLKMWFQDGSKYESSHNYDIYKFYRNITIRAGEKFKYSQDGVTVYAGLSKIHVCLPTPIEPTKKCYHSCSDCDGPTSSNCLSCTDNRYLDNRQCKCNFGSIESNDGICMTFNNLYPNSIQRYIVIDQHQSRFGWFLVQGRYIKCPRYSEQDRKIYCVECLIDPEGFALSLTCKTDYFLNQYGQYQRYARDARDIEFYILDLESLYLCQGCQFCDININSNCHLENNQIYIQCSDGYYYDSFECKACLNDCLTCDNADTCTECNGNLIKNSTNICVSCPQNCQECYFDDSFNLLCSKCVDRFSLHEGQCIACGSNCQACQYTFDDLTNSYYNKCIYCIDSSQYYLELNGVSCAQNTITNCRYVIQFHRSWYIRPNINTMLYNFKRRTLASGSLVTYCALCNQGYSATMLHECIPITPAIDPSGICTMMFQIEDWQEEVYYLYAYYCQMYSQQLSQSVTQISNSCWQYLKNCLTCYQTMCLDCFPGYYANILTGNCNPCPDDLKCHKCLHQSKLQKNGWKIWYKMIYELITTQSFYSDVFGNEDADKMEVVCSTCNPGYELYNGRCIVECAANCNTCVKQQGQNYCVECKIYSGKLLSLYDGQCIECPRYCSLCQPNNQTANPYFNNEAQISTTHTCLLLDQSLNPEEYIYNSDFKQFFKYSSDGVDPNQVIMEFNLYCDLDQFDLDLRNSLDQKRFLSSNVRFDEIMTQRNRIENEYFYSFLGSSQIQQIELKFQLLSDCTVHENSILFTTLTKNVYFLNQAIITLIGNSHNLILYSQLDIFGFDRVEFTDLNIVIIGSDFNLNFSSENSLEINFNSVNFSSEQESNFKFLMTNVKSLNLTNFSIWNATLNNINSFFTFNQAKNTLSISISISIHNSTIKNSNLFVLDQIMFCQVNKIQVFDSNFTHTSIISTQYISLTMTDLIFQNVLFVDSAPIFATYLLNEFQLIQGKIINSIFENSIIFQISKLTNLQFFSLIDSQLYNSSLLLQNSSSTSNSVKLYNFSLQNVTYDKVYSILYASSGIIDLTNWSINQLQSNNDSTLNTYIIQPLLFCEADQIILNQIELTRGRGITEFYLSLASNIYISNLIMNINNFFPSLITQCKQDYSYFQFQTVINIEKSQKIYFTNVTINNLIIFNVPLIYISSISTQIIKRVDTITVNNLIINDCILQQIQSINLIALIYVISEQQIDITFVNSQFNNNFYYTTESEQNSALSVNFNVQNGKVQLSNCQFYQNYISQSQIGLLNIIADTINIMNSRFIKNNRFSRELLKHVNWGYSIKELTLSYLSTYFPVISLNGNGKLSSDTISLQNVSVYGSTAQQAGCFYTTLQNIGTLSILDSVFQEIYTKNNGGCFYIGDKTTQLSVLIKNSKFNSIYCGAEGGGVYLLPGSQIVQINLTNTTIVNTFSLEGAFIKLGFKYLTQAIYVRDCNIFYSIDGLARFLQTNMDQVQSSKLAKATAVIVISQGIVSFRNIVSQLYIFGLLESTYSNKISLISVVVENSYYGARPAIQISCSQGISLNNQDENCKVNFKDFQVTGFQFYNNSNYYLESIKTQIYSLKQRCSTSIVLIEETWEVITIDFSIFGKDNISSVVQISNIKSNDSVGLKKSNMISNQCLGCQNGLFELIFLQEITNNKNFDFTNIQIADNNCGRYGCLTFQLKINSRILSETSNQIQISHLICNKNTAINGSCIYSQGIGLIISESIINENTATSYGGGIYFSGDVQTLLIYNNLITSNTALAGSAIYIDQNSSPELNKTNNYLQQQQSVSSYPTSLTITLDNYKNVLQNFNQIHKGFITLDLKEEAIITLPSGQEISQYRYFNLTSQEYINLNLTLRIVPMNNYYERQYNLTSSECTIQSGYFQNGTLKIVNNLTSYNQKEFNTTTQDYNFDDLILYSGHTIILLFECNSVKIPIYDSIFPYSIVNYIRNYTLQLTIQTFNCQLGEYKNDDSCYLCDVNKKLYSVIENATTCSYMDEESTISITPAQLQLKNGFWRPTISNGIIEKCLNRLENCLGGWKQGDDSCLQGQVGARCESCDTYNIRGKGQYNKKQLYICEECDSQQNQIFYIIAISLWMLLSLYLTTKGIQNMVAELQKNRIGLRQLLINNNKQTGPIMKMFTNYLQNIAIILNFNIEIPNSIKSYFTLFGNSQQLLLISTDCFLAQHFQENIMYVQILQCFINPLIYGILFTLIYITYLYFSKGQFEKIVITTSVLYLFCYFQPQAIQQLISTLSYQNLSGIDWIQANLAYKFYTDEHLKWLPYLIALAAFLGVIVPIYLLSQLFYHKKKLYINQLRRNWGYLFLEYQPKAYYWEFIRISIRESMILAITFYQDNIAIKCVLVFIIFFVYQQATHSVSPYKTSKLNQLDNRYSQICNFTIICMLTLTVVQGFYNLFVILIIVPNIYLFCSFSSSLITGYVEAYEQSLDKLKDTIRGKFPKFIEKWPFLKKQLINKGIQRQKIKEKFKLIKKHLFSCAIESASKVQKFTIQTTSTSRYHSSHRSGLSSPRDGTQFFLIPQIVLSTNENQQQSDPKGALLK